MQALWARVKQQTRNNDKLKIIRNLALRQRSERVPALGAVMTLILLKLN